jgi:hypothetical protein
MAEVLQMILLPILFAGVIVTGSAAPSSPIELPSAWKPASTLLSAATAATRRDALSIGPAQRLRPIAARPVRSTGRHSVATRASAIFAGAVMGALGGILAGATVDKMASGGECATFANYGMPIGAAVGGVLTARYVR